MASVKLNNTLRDEIVNNATADAFAAEGKQLQDDILLFSNKVYGQHITPESVEKLAKKLPDGYGLYISFIGVRFLQTNETYAPVKSMGLTFDQPRLVQESMRYGGFGIVDADLFNEAIEFDKRKAAIAEAVDDLRTQVRGVVNSVTTVEKLLLAWPESKQFIPSYAFNSAAKTNLPAIVIEGLNNELEKAIGRSLTVEEPEAIAA